MLQLKPQQKAVERKHSSLHSCCDLNLMQTYFFSMNARLFTALKGENDFIRWIRSLPVGFVLCCPRCLVPCWKPHFIPWSHYCLRLRCPHSLWFVGNELAPPCPCSIILIEKVIFHSTEQIGEGESMNSNQELTCSRPTEKLTTGRLMPSRWSRWGMKSDERNEDQKQDRVRPHRALESK